MKRIFFTSAAVMLTLIGVQASANDNNATAKNDSRPGKAERRELRKEKKEERTNFRKFEDNEVSYQSREAFIRTYGDLPVTWTKGKHFDEAVFDKDGIKTTAYFDTDAQLVGTTAIKSFTDLPKSAQNQITKMYGDYDIASVMYFDDNEEIDTDMVLYGGEFEDEDNYFVELKKDNRITVLQVDTYGRVGLFAGAEK